MQTKEITIRVTSDAACVYELASEQERRKMDVFLSMRLYEMKEPSRSLDEIMQEAGKKAKEQGLTKEILRELLNE